jgi:hypothetical protein
LDYYKRVLDEAMKLSHLKNSVLLTGRDIIGNITEELLAKSKWE